MIRQDLLPTDHDIRFFNDCGYWIAGKTIGDEQLEALREAMDQVYAGRFETGHEPWMGWWKPDGDPLQVRKTDQSHWANNALRALATDETIGAMAARLMNTREVRLWHDQLLYKPGHGNCKVSDAGNVGWHQDFNYWQCTVPDLVTAWVAFDDVPVKKGCMRFVRGSNRWGLLNFSDFFNTNLAEMERRIRQQVGSEFEFVPAEMQAGQVSFHHCMTIHGSGPNSTAQPRRSMAIHLMPQHACYVGGSLSDGHMNALLMLRHGRKEGDLFKGDSWPVVYRAQG